MKNNYFNNSTKKEKKPLKKLKKKLSVYLILISVFFLIVVFDRVFYIYFTAAENDLIENIQEAFLLNDYKTNNVFFKIIGEIGGFRYMILLITHFYMILYFAVDILITIKVMSSHFIGKHSKNINNKIEIEGKICLSLDLFLLNSFIFGSLFIAYFLSLNNILNLCL